MKYKNIWTPDGWATLLAHDLANWKTKSVALWFNFSLKKHLYDMKTKKIIQLKKIPDTGSSHFYNIL